LRRSALEEAFADESPSVSVGSKPFDSFGQLVQLEVRERSVVSVLPSFDKIVRCFGASHVLVSVSDLIGCLVRQPVLPDQLNLLVSVLSQSQQ
jgi:hypothetical protein